MPRQVSINVDEALKSGVIYIDDKVFRLMSAENTNGPYFIKLTDCGSRKLQVVKIIKTETGLGLSPSKYIADTLGYVKENVTIELAKHIGKLLSDVGASFIIGRTNNFVEEEPSSVTNKFFY